MLGLFEVSKALMHRPHLRLPLGLGAGSTELQILEVIKNAARTARARHEGGADEFPAHEPAGKRGLSGGEQGYRALDADGRPKTPHVFDKAQNDVQKLMERDGFIRFKQSPLFSDFMKEVRGAQRSRTIPHDSLQTCTRLARARTAESKLGLVVADNSAGTGRGRSTMRRPGGRG